MAHDFHSQTSFYNDSDIARIKPKGTAYRKAKINMAGIAASVALTMNTTIDQNGIFNIYNRYCIIIVIHIHAPLFRGLVEQY